MALAKRHSCVATESALCRGPGEHGVQNGVVGGGGGGSVGPLGPVVPSPPLRVAPLLSGSEDSLLQGDLSARRKCLSCLEDFKVYRLSAM